jgi:type VI secretion system protein ImpC
MASKPESAAVAASATPVSGALLDSILEAVDVTRPEKGVVLDDVLTPEAIARHDKNAMITTALSVLLKLVAESEKPVEKIDKEFMNGLIAQIDHKLSQQLDEIMHSPELQSIESTWRGLKLLVDRTDFRRNVKIELINASKDDLSTSFAEAPELIQSPLYRKVYSEAYDMPGAAPYSAMVANYEFVNSAQDVVLLRQVSKVAAAAHCPFIGAVGPEFFGKKSMEEWKKIPDLKAHLETNDFIQWRGLRQEEDSRYLGIVFPRFLLRLPYDPETNPVKSFHYTEGVKGPDHEKYLWGNATFAFASNLSRAFVEDGWCIQIRGPQSGGRVGELPVHLYDVGKGKQVKVPTEIPIDETLDFTASNLGFMPLSWYENEDYACFFSANSTQKVEEHPTKPEVTANRRINARLPYIMLASRLAHYLKVQQRENVGSNRPREIIEQQLNEWIQTLVGEMKTSDQAYLNKYPLRAAQIKVDEVADNPGFYRVSMMVLPRFQIEGMDINLAIVGQLPTGK